METDGILYNVSFAKNLLDGLTILLHTERLARSDYTRIRSLWRTWLSHTKQDSVPPSLGDYEMSTMSFVDYTLSKEEQIQALDDTFTDDNVMLLAMEEAVGQGYRLAVTRDKKNKCIMCTIIGKDPSCANYDKAMTSRHKTVRSAIAIALFKHRVIFEQGSWGDSSGEAMFG